MSQGEQSVFQKGHGVIIGVGTEDIPQTEADATALFDLLTDQSRCGYPASQVKLLTRSGSTRNAILGALDNLAAACAADPEATAIRLPVG